MAREKINEFSIWARQNITSMQVSLRSIHSLYVSFVIIENYDPEDEKHPEYGKPPTIAAIKARLSHLDFLEVEHRAVKRGGTRNMYRLKSLQEREGEACNCLCAIGKIALKMVGK